MKLLDSEAADEVCVFDEQSQSCRREGHEGKGRGGSGREILLLSHPIIVGTAQ